MKQLNMKIIKINNFTYFFLIIAFLCGYIKIALIILFIVLFHELGHVFFIKLFKYKIKDITIYPFGGITHIDKKINTPLNQELLIALGGILFQIILYLIPLNGLTKSYFIKYNTSILLFNLLPIIPLDGSIILNTLLNKIFSFVKSYYLYLIISIISIGGYLYFNYTYSLNNYFIISLFIIKTYEAYKNYQYIYYRFLLERYLYDYHFKYLSTKKGSLKILKRDTYQYFKEDHNIISEKKKLNNYFKH